jgi:hypothetical protein
MVLLAQRDSQMPTRQEVSHDFLINLRQAVNRLVGEYDGEVVVWDQYTSEGEPEDTHMSVGVIMKVMIQPRPTSDSSDRAH